MLDAGKKPESTHRQLSEDIALRVLGGGVIIKRSKIGQRDVESTNAVLEVLEALLPGHTVQHALLGGQLVAGSVQAMVELE